MFSYLFSVDVNLIELRTFKHLLYILLYILHLSIYYIFYCTF